jgi:hypothetical protein
LFENIPSGNTAEESFIQIHKSNHAFLFECILMKAIHAASIPTPFKKFPNYD